MEDQHTNTQKCVKGQRNNLGGCVPHSAKRRKGQRAPGHANLSNSWSGGGGPGIWCRRGVPLVPFPSPKEEAESINCVISYAGGIACWLGTNRHWGGRTHVEIA